MNSTPDIKKFGVLFVCMGNICRSPTAQGVFQQKIDRAGMSDRVFVDSAGTHNYHPGSPPDSRSQRHAAARGYDLSVLRARQITHRDAEQFDLFLAMDWNNLAHMEGFSSLRNGIKLRRMTEFCLHFKSDVVPDPYYGEARDFEHVLDLVEDASEGLLRHIQKTHPV